MYTAIAYGKGETYDAKGNKVTATSSATATSTISYADALNKAQIIADSNAKSQAETDANVIVQTIDIVEKNCHCSQKNTNEDICQYFEDTLIENNSFISAGHEKIFTLTNPKPINRGDPPSLIGDLWIDYKINFSNDGIIGISMINAHEEEIEVTRIGFNMPPSDNYEFVLTNKFTNGNAFYILNDNILSFISNCSCISSWDISYKINNMTSSLNIGISNKNTSLLGMVFVLNYDNNQMVISADTVEYKSSVRLVLPNKFNKIDKIPFWIKYNINLANLKINFNKNKENDIDNSKLTSQPTTQQSTNPSSQPSRQSSQRPISQTTNSKPNPCGCK